MDALQFVTSTARGIDFIDNFPQFLDRVRPLSPTLFLVISFHLQGRDSDPSEEARPEATLFTALLLAYARHPGPKEVVPFRRAPLLYGF